MNIVLGKTAGFCYGVKRAVEEALTVANNNDNVYCLGELVHNKQVTYKLEAAGIKLIENIETLQDDEKDKNVIIRAHGVPKEVYEYASKNQIKLIDLTCPNVLKVHEIAQKYSEKGYYIFLTGKKEHPENIGTTSYCKEYSIIEEVEDVSKALKALKDSEINKLLLISQTTYSLEKFYLIREKISYYLDANIQFDIENTICPTTEIRQKEAQKISKEVECMIIIGGNNSSNTKKLYEIAEKNCKNVYLVENSIDAEKVKKFETIGIMAGASTPENSIKYIIELLNKEK